MGILIYKGKELTKVPRIKRALSRYHCSQHPFEMESKIRLYNELHKRVDLPDPITETNRFLLEITTLREFLNVK